MNRLETNDTQRRMLITLIISDTIIQRLQFFFKLQMEEFDFFYSFQERLFF